MGINGTRCKEEEGFLSGEYKIILGNSDNGQGSVALILGETSTQALLDIKTIGNSFMLPRFSS